ncbi:hypothetical protein LZ24_02486 [Desulfobotulus alkaliphilus]|uniref:Uncharacterized protein n=1 Tax=Desulfobotulus alkaliphilus TaxID=622671 RepID=A0A562RJ08_9BACT|nr:hypothetical protein [Desulfobotulus alkaliphilus]TWI68514.1 hypothetical protein LZ24_02486 [Desulfobotulus alkaliphilus]
MSVIDYNPEILVFSENPVLGRLQRYSHYAICRMGLPAFLLLEENGIFIVPEEVFGPMIHQYSAGVWPPDREKPRGRYRAPMAEPNPENFCVPLDPDRMFIPDDPTEAMLYKTFRHACVIVGAEVVSFLERSGMIFMEESFFLDCLKVCAPEVWGLMDGNPRKINPLGRIISSGCPIPDNPLNDRTHHLQPAQADGRSPDCC